MTIRSRILLSLIFASIAPLLVFGIWKAERDLRLREEEFGRTELEHARTILQSTETYFDAKLKLLAHEVTEHGIASVIEAGDAVLASAGVGSIAAESEYVSVSVFDSRGEPISSTDSESANVFAEAWFQAALGGSNTIGNVTRCGPDSTIAVRLAVPIRAVTDSRSVIGVLAVQFRWDELYEILSRFRIRGRPQSVSNHFMLTDKDGLALWCFDRAGILSDNLIEHGMISVREARAGREGYILEASEHGEISFSVYTPYRAEAGRPDPGWILVVLHDPEEVFGAVRAANLNFFLMISCGAVALILMSLRIASDITRPIRKVTTAIREFDPEVPVRKLETTDSGEIGFLAKSFNEMSEGLTQSRRKLMESEEKYRAYVERCPEGIIIMDSAGRCIEVNDASCRLLGYAKEELEKLAIVDLTAPGERETCSGHMRSLFDIGYATCDVTFLRKDGLSFPATVAASRISEERYILFLIDHTERKRMEAEIFQSEKLAALGRMAAGISHEMSQPLNAIKNFSQGILLNMEEGIPVSPERLKENLARTIDQVDRMAEIIRNMRLYTRKDESERVRLDLNALVLYPFTFLGAQLRAHGIEIDHTLHPDPLPIIGSENRLQQVFINLVINARDAIMAKPNADGGRIEIVTSCEGDEWVCGEVRDSGIGIPDSELQKIFEPFYTTKGPDHGTGLGLSLSYEIIAMHGGEITVSSVEGAGTTFKVRLPRSAPKKQKEE